MGYVNAERLVELVRLAQAEGRVGEELAGMITKIAAGVWTLHRSVDRDDFQQDCVIRFMREYHRIDVSRKPAEVFSYISWSFMYLEQHRGRQKLIHQVCLRKYARHLSQRGELPIKQAFDKK